MSDTDTEVIAILIKYIHDTELVRMLSLPLATHTQDHHFAFLMSLELECVIE